MKKHLLFLSLALASLFVTGCASMSAQKAPGANLSTIKTVYVAKLAADGRGINQVITDQLHLMGYQATTGANARPDTPVDAIITYQDKWMWDITMYMIQLEVQVRNPDNQFVLASGRSYRPSLERKAPADMAREVLESIFKQP